MISINLLSKCIVPKTILCKFIEYRNHEEVSVTSELIDERLLPVVLKEV